MDICYTATGSSFVYLAILCNTIDYALCVMYPSTFCLWFGLRASYYTELKIFIVIKCINLFFYSFLYFVSCFKRSWLPQSCKRRKYLSTSFSWCSLSKFYEGRDLSLVGLHSRPEAQCFMVTGTQKPLSAFCRQILQVPAPPFLKIPPHV